MSSHDRCLIITYNHDTAENIYFENVNTEFQCNKVTVEFIQFDGQKRNIFMYLYFKIPNRLRSGGGGGVINILFYVILFLFCLTDIFCDIEK